MITILLMSFVTLIALYYIIREKIQSKNNNQRRDVNNVNKIRKVNDFKEKSQLKSEDLHESEDVHQLIDSTYCKMFRFREWMKKLELLTSF